MWLLLGQALSMAHPFSLSWELPRPALLHSLLLSFMFLRKDIILSYRHVEECRGKRFQMLWP